MTIGEAVLALQAGQKVARAGWNGRDQRLTLQSPELHSKMTRPYVYLHTADHQRVPWTCSQTDLLADDWFVVQ